MQKQGCAETLELVNRLYGPILWRKLSVANYKTRVNAVSVLASVWPLTKEPASTDEPQSAKQYKEDMEQQCKALESILEDKCQLCGTPTKFRVEKSRKYSHIVLWK